MHGPESNSSILVLRSLGQIGLGSGQRQEPSSCSIIGLGKSLDDRLVNWYSNRDPLEHHEALLDEIGAT